VRTTDICPTRLDSSLLAIIGSVTTLSRNDFTPHGLHLNISGKEKMAELIVTKKRAVRKEETPITLKFEENLKDHTQEETKKN
jgi:hypothetical protein